jgi:YggT family protein
VRILADLVGIYLVILVLRAVLSWFPVHHGSPLATINRVLLDLTEPVVAPVRRMIPPAGQFDIAFMVVFFALFILWQSLSH